MLRIATRRSALARAQAQQVAALITQRTGEDCELVPMVTTGDRHPGKAVTAFDAKGLFVDTVRQAVIGGDCDLVVHSFKDLPHDDVPELAIAMVPERADPRDALLTRDGYALANLPATATVGTSSERRRLQLLRARPSLQVLPVRGNVDTRVRKVAEGELDGVVVAAAGLERLAADPEGRDAIDRPVKVYLLEPGECLPAPAQGVLAVESRADDQRMLDIGALVTDPVTAVCARAERAFAAALGGGCSAAVGALCTSAAREGAGPDVRDGLELIGLVGDPGRRRMVRRSAHGSADDPEGLGRRLAADARGLLEHSA